MAGRFENKIVLVTGAASGIGAATALAFAKEGATVVVADLQEAAGEGVVQAIRSFGSEGSFIRSNVAEPADIEAMVKRTVELYGRLDIAINNAGILQESTPLADIPDDTFDRILAINLKSVFLGMKCEIQQMLRQGGGVIVNMTSFAGLIGFQGFSAYVASKHGVAGLTRSAALDYAQQGIRINAIAPGVVRTPMLDQVPPEGQAAIASVEPIGRLAEPEEIARSILYLASEDASFMIGHVMAVDGGLTIQ